mmetsp:Transcript_38640/g.98025  ORF Transcript_38640/g.98025 Transcript_38640/m.98025 type:complete len:322 (-) Transcript_38640:132-1097(-)
MVEAPEEEQPEAAEYDEAEADERSAALRAESTLNPSMGGGGAVDAAGTAAALQRCMLALMDEFLDDDGARVRYGALRASGEFAEFVMTAGDLCDLPMSSLDASAPTDERKAFWINLYNCLVMHGTTVAGAPKDAPARKAFFSGASGVAYRVAGCRLTLDDIEHGILRCNTPPPGAEAPPFGEGDARLALCLPPPTDPRVHFALNCGARSCPPIKLYDASRLEQGLDLATRAFVESDLRVERDAGSTGAARVTLSKILDWYGSDFGADEAAVLGRLQGFLPEESAQHAALAEALRRPAAELQVTYREYDWGGNDATPDEQLG